MEQKTDLSREFGPLPNCSQQEFGSTPAALDFRTDPSSEFSKPPDLESGNTYADQEFSQHSGTESAPKKPSRRDRHRRTLLLQMAAVGLSAVVVTSSFGLDILGDSSSSAPSGSGDSESLFGEIIIERIDEDSKYSDSEPLYATSFAVYQEEFSNYDPGPYANSVRYDKDSNTLYLDGCEVDVLKIYEMGPDFTIHIENTSWIGLLESYGSSITFSGRDGTALHVNQHDAALDWGHGIILYGQSRDISLTVEPGIAITAHGRDGAIAVVNTASRDAIRYDKAYTTLSGQVRSGDFGLRDGPYMDRGNPDWVVANEDGEPAQDVTFMPLGSTAPTLPPLEQGTLRVSLPGSNDPVYLVKDAVPTSYADGIDGLSYDFATNTLTLRDFSGYSLESCGMPELTLDLYGENRLSQICTDSTLIFDGDPYAALTVNEDRQFSHGILLAAEGEDCSVLVNWGPEIDVYGTEAAVAVSNSSSEQGIRLGTDVILSGDIAFGRFTGDSPSLTSGLRSWTVFDASSGNEPSTHVVFSRDYAHDPTAQSSLSITVSGASTVLFENGRPTEGTWPAGVTYLHCSNTLVLDQVTFDSIEAYRMGEGFTLELCGENYGKTIYTAGSSNSADGSLLITGEHFGDGKTYGSLYLSAGSEPYGVLLDANGGSSTLKFGWIYEVLISAHEAAVLVRNTTAESGILNRSDAFSVETNTGIDWTFQDYDTGEVSKEFRDNGGFGGGMEVTVLNGISVLDFPSYDALRWIWANGYQTVYVESTDGNDTAEPVDGMSYDELTNTLTLTNCTAQSLEVVLMGDDFTVRVMGDNRVGSIIINACNVTFTGSGTLTVGDSQSVYSRGIYLDAQNRSHQIRVDGGVSLRVYGNIYIHATTATEPVVFSSGFSTSSLLVKNYLRDSYYDVTTDSDIGAANYSYAEYGRTGSHFTEHLHSSYVEIMRN